MKLRYEAIIKDEDEDEILGFISAPTMTMLEEKLGKLERIENNIVSADPETRCINEECNNPVLGDLPTQCADCIG